MQGLHKIGFSKIQKLDFFLIYGFNFKSNGCLDVELFNIKKNTTTPLLVGSKIFN
jgi:hypothetical protein